MKRESPQSLVQSQKREAREAIEQRSNGIQGGRGKKGSLFQKGNAWVHPLVIVVAPVCLLLSSKTDERVSILTPDNGVCFKKLNGEDAK